MISTFRALPFFAPSHHFKCCSFLVSHLNLNIIVPVQRQILTIFTVQPLIAQLELVDVRVPHHVPKLGGVEVRMPLEARPQVEVVRPLEEHDRHLSW